MQYERRTARVDNEHSRELGVSPRSIFDIDILSRLYVVASVAAASNDDIKRQRARNKKTKIHRMRNYMTTFLRGPAQIKRLCRKTTITGASEEGLIRSVRFAVGRRRDYSAVN